MAVIRACSLGDAGCLDGSSAEHTAAKYTCDAERYSPSERNHSFQDNDDCLFCPWSRSALDVDSLYNETERIYAHLDSEAVCNVTERVMLWQGQQSMADDTANDTKNWWRRNRLNGGLLWNLSSRLAVADPMAGNQRSAPTEYVEEDFNAVSCSVAAGDDGGEMEIEYLLNREGEGHVAVSVLQSEFGDAGWISFGRGGGGISAMLEGHVVTALFDSALTDIEFVAHYMRDFAVPTTDREDDQFLNSEPAISLIADRVTFQFDTVAGEWMEDQLPIIVAFGALSGTEVGSEDMVMHSDKDVLYVDLEATECLLGGLTVSQ